MTTVAPVVSTGRRGGVALALGPVAIALATGVILAEAVDVLAVNHGLASSLRSGWTQLVAPAFIVLVLLALVCERIWPAERRLFWPEATCRTPATSCCTSSPSRRS